MSYDLGKVDLRFDLGPQADRPTPTPETIVNSNDDTASPSGTSSFDNIVASVSAPAAASFTKGNITTTGEWTSTNKFKVRGQDLVRERVPVIGGVFNLCFS
ncbi:hypothetical protein BG015_010052 [Linnemannia schmuckeri]|uniref:Uncharacterized protein n=1 Tax=Linnemannia schmuckeri TaxID=64567 RepID=A0A9P5RUM7_9FUNG|nr:hypothetical protein BG015_010052 [Linnemannia schmuckeri]